MNTEWRDINRVLMTINAIVLGYQVVIGKTLGKSFGGMTQMLLREVGNLLSDIVDQLVGDIEYSEEKLVEAIERSLVATGIAKDVKVEELPSEVKHSYVLRRFSIKITDSIFKPIYKVLSKYGYKEFPLSPEGMLVAAVVLKVLKQSNKSAKLNMKARLPTSEDEALEIIVEQIIPSRT
ncbi:hypothetical protein [Pyrofollis japonicus]|uniref:hypothetical protein n=1 Tax=Pyrofollis japonicus TaxID=3060460 RepID=UPI00295AC643|nr:hypothetical protein [Pyrofollis japonicus]